MLYLQHQQRFTAIWEVNDRGVLRIRDHCHMQGWTLHEQITPYIIIVGLYTVGHLDTIPIDHELVTAMTEWWRKETHTFSFLISEATFTLYNVVVLLRLEIDG